MWGDNNIMRSRIILEDIRAHLKRTQIELKALNDQVQRKTQEIDTLIDSLKAQIDLANFKDDTKDGKIK